LGSGTNHRQTQNGEESARNIPAINHRCLLKGISFKRTRLEFRQRSLNAILARIWFTATNEK
jgi:hypothetical protein